MILFLIVIVFVIVMFLIALGTLLWSVGKMLKGIWDDAWDVNPLDN